MKDGTVTEERDEWIEHDLGPNALKAVAFICATALGVTAACLDGQEAILAVVALAAGIAGVTGYAAKRAKE